MLLAIKERTFKLIWPFGYFTLNFFSDILTVAFNNDDIPQS